MEIQVHIHVCVYLCEGQRTTSSVIPQVTRPLPGMKLVMLSSLVSESKDLLSSASPASSSHHDEYF